MNRRYKEPANIPDRDTRNPDELPPHTEAPPWQGDFNPYHTTTDAPGVDPYYGALGYRDVDAYRYRPMRGTSAVGEWDKSPLVAHTGRVTTTIRMVGARWPHRPK
jgi:hypothetical protein